MRLSLLSAGFHFAAALVAVSLVCCGCNRGSSDSGSEDEATTDRTTQVTGDPLVDQKDSQVTENGVTDDGTAQGELVSLDELNADIAVFMDTSKWYYGSRPDGEPVGTWLSQDADSEPLIFEKDGSFKCGFLWSRGEGVYSTGKYAISENGLIVAVTKHKGGRLGLFYNLRDGTIVGSRGPTPLVEWKKTKSAEE
ncbi:MAG: hypothetical protein ABGX07_13735 [Pirellulaceae bacterium]